MPEGRLLGLIIVFAPLSLLSLGGGTSVFSEMQRQAVSVHGWMSDRDFVDLFAISRVAPGPGTLIAALVGWKVAGWIGALVAALGMFVPSSVLAYCVGLWWRRSQHSRLRLAIERGLGPPAVGLIFAGAWRVLQSGEAGPLQYATAILTVVACLRDIGPYTILGVTTLVYGALLF